MEQQSVEEYETEYYEWMAERAIRINAHVKIRSNVSQNERHHGIRRKL